jgi:shikimate kinase
MIIALFGIACVGKTTVGRMISDDLKCAFYDLDDEFSRHFNDTIENLQKRFWLGNEYDRQKGVVLKSILSKCEKNAVIAMSPIYYTMSYKHLFL